MSEISIANDRLPPSSEILDQTVLRADSPNERAVFRLLAFADVRDVSPGPLLHELAADMSGASRVQILALANSLDQGLSIADALLGQPGLIRPENAMAVRLAIGADARNAIFQEIILSDELAGENWGDRSVGTNLFSSIGQLLFCIFLVSFLLIFIIPTFEEMFDEFELVLPAPTLLLISISHAAQSFLPSLVLLVVLVLVVIGIRRLITYAKIVSNRGFDMLALRKSPMSDSSRLLPLLSIGAQGGVLFRAIVYLSNHHPRPSICAKLKGVMQRVDKGENLFQAMRRNGLLSKHEARSLGKTTSETTQAWLLRFMAARRQSRRCHWFGFLQRLVSFATVLCVVLVVGLAAVSVFMPLVSMIQSLSG